MTPQAFVLALKVQAANSAQAEVDYYQNPPLKNPPEHLKRFSQWFSGLSERDREIVTELIKYAKEGELFSVLTYIDNLACLSPERGRFELFFVDQNQKRVQLNMPDDELLTDIFNNEG